LGHFQNGQFKKYQHGGGTNNAREIPKTLHGMRSHEKRYEDSKQNLAD
jgi:hypothetical protein